MQYIICIVKFNNNIIMYEFLNAIELVRWCACPLTTVTIPSWKKTTKLSMN